jgi:Ca2+-binding EF-hand superfamily protein
MKAWELMIMNERAVEVIRQRIAKRYRYDMERAFMTCDLNRDGFISISDVSILLINYVI